MDTLGHVVLCRSPYEDSFAAHSLLLQPAEPIASHFYVSYGSALQMLRTRSPAEMKPPPHAARLCRGRRQIRKAATRRATNGRAPHERMERG